MGDGMFVTRRKPVALETEPMDVWVHRPTAPATPPVDALHLAPAQLGGPDAVPLLIAPASPADLGYVFSTWLESFHRAKDEHSRTFRGSGWRDRQATLVNRLLADAGTRSLVIRHPTETVQGAPAILGWLVWSPADRARMRSLPAVHYAYVRHHLGSEEWRRRGVLTALLAEADLGQRLAYTHRGEYWRGGYGKGRRHLARPLDEEIVAWLARRGVTAVYEPKEIA